jgi:hypothetical protein
MPTFSVPATEAVEAEGELLEAVELLPQAAREAIPREPLSTTAAILVTRRKGFSLVDAHLTGAD